MDDKKDKVVLTLRIAAFCVFIGRSIQHLFHDAPYRTILRDEDLLAPLLEQYFNLSWKTYSLDPIYGEAIISGIKFIGYFYLLCAGITIFLKGSQNPLAKIAGKALLVGSMSLTFLAFLYFKHEDFKIGVLFEYSAQVSVPIFFYLSIFYRKHLSAYIRKMKLAVALTFLGHGMFAIGYYRHPGDWLRMLEGIFHVNYAAAHWILYTAGALDILFVICIFLPRMDKPVLWYAIIWGFLTAMARAIYPMISVLTVYNFIYRVPHFLLPLAIFLLIQNVPRNKAS